MMKIKNEGRYRTDRLLEGEYEPGSNDLVLKNLQHIKDKNEMDLLEASLLTKTLDKLLDKYGASYSFTVNDICKIHKTWLGGIYSWAGKYRI